MNIRVVRLLLVFSALLIVSCSTKTDLENEYEEYLGRLENTLDSQRESVTVIAKPILYPSTSIAVERVTITLLDFLRLFGCELQYTIGQRNNQTGKVAPASQQLINALMFQQQAKACIDLQKQRDNDALAEALISSVEQKRLQLPALIYNATLASDEFSAMWQYRPQVEYPANVSSELVSAIERLHTFTKAWLAGDYSVGLDELESTLAVIRTGDAGTLWYALTISYHNLSVANQLIKQRTGLKKLCYMGKPTPQSKVFETVLRKFFIQRIQVRQSRINKRYHELLPAINELEETLRPVLVDDYRHWRQQRQLHFVKLLSAPRNHVAHIKLLVEQCGSSFGTTIKKAKP